MSSDCPPQLQLSIQPSTTTFKRSFEQFDFGLDSPLGVTDAGGSGTDNGSERNKRARSSSSFSQSSDSTDGSTNTVSTLASGPESSSSSSRDERSAITNELPVILPPVRSTIDPPPRLPTPLIQDVDMDELMPQDATDSVDGQQQTPQRAEERYRLSLERFNAFENEIALLRRSQPLSPVAARSSTPPPMLPPLSIVSSSDQHLNQHQNTHQRARAIPPDLGFFRHPPPRSSSPFLDHFLNDADGSPSALSDSVTGGEVISGYGSPGPQEGTSTFQNALFRFRRHSLSSSLSRRDEHEHQQRPHRDAHESADEIQMVNGFRDRLNTALERLRSASPLVPGLEGIEDGVGNEDVGQDQDQQEMQQDVDEIEDQNEDEERRTASSTYRPSIQTLPPNPPTLPPIPPITADTDADDWVERPLTGRPQGDSMEPEIRASAASQNELQAQVMREIRERQIEMRQQLQNLRSISSSSNPGWPPPPSSSSISGNPSLNDHPLPSPILRDLHSWMQERGPFGETSTGDATDPSTSGQQFDSSAATLESNPTNSHADQRQPLYHGFSPISTVGSSEQVASAEGSSSLASTSGTAHEPTGSSSVTAAASSSNNSDLPANTISVSYRNIADEAAVRSLDHGVAMGLGFGRPGAARPMPPSMSIDNTRSTTPRRNDGTILEPRHIGSPTVTSTANGLGQPPAHRPITRLPSGNWSSWVRESGMGPLPDLDLDFSSMAGTAGSSLSSPSMSDDWNSEAFTAAPLGDRPPAVRDSSPTTTTTISLDDSLLNPTMTSLDLFSTTAAAGSGPGPANHSSASHSRNPWAESHSSFTHQRQHPSHSRHRLCPHNPQCVYAPTQLNYPGASASTSTNLTTSDLERPHPELRRNFGTSNADRSHDEYRRWLMDNDSSYDSDSPSLPNRIPSSSSSLLSRLQNTNRTMDARGPLSFRRLSSSITSTEPNPIQQTISPSSRLRTSHSRARLGSSTSLVSENASEMRRLADHAEIARTRAMHALSTGSGVSDDEDRATAENTRVENSTDEHERGVRRVQQAWDELRAMHRDLHRRVSGSQAPDADTNAGDTRSSFHRLVQNAWQSIESPDISLSSPQDEHQSWLSRNPPTTTPAATTEDVEMSFSDRTDDRDVYWSTFLRDLGIENPFDSGNPRPSSSTSQNRREGWESDYNPYSLSWSDTIPHLNSDNRSSGTASTSTPPIGEGPAFTSSTSRFPSFSSYTERNSREAMNPRVEMPPRRFPSIYSHVPSLPSPDLGVTFSAAQAAQAIPTSGVARPPESSRHFSGLSNRHPTVTTHGNYAANTSHYQNHATSTNPHSTSLQFRYSRGSQRMTDDSTIPRLPSYVTPDWDMILEPTEDNSVDARLFASLLESRERLAQLSARHHARVASLQRANNLAEFAPGPFRNTLQHNLEQHQANQRRAEYLASVPPSIPPLSFDDSHLASLAQPMQRPETRTLDETVPHSIAVPFPSSREMPARRESVRPVRPGAPAGLDNYSHPITTRSFASARAEANRVRAQTELFLLNRHTMRMEASRSGDPSTQRGGTTHSSNHNLEEVDRITRNRQTSEMLRNRNRARYMANTDTSGPQNRQTVYPGMMDDEDGSREGFSTFSARARRNRFQFPHEMMFFSRGGRRGRPLGDFMRDEDFDESYESLLSLAQTLGDVKPRSTPAEIIEKMETAQYKDWATPESDQRCPICLDDYTPTDHVLKLTNCSHWLHQGCLQQWLQTANTCPVCRKSVSTNTGFRRSNTHHHRNNPFSGISRRDPPPNPGSSQGASSNAGNNPSSSSSTQGHHHNHFHGFPPAPWRRGPPQA